MAVSAKAPRTSSAGMTRIASAGYIENMLVELRTIGQNYDLDFLVYLLEMATIEASDIANGKGTAPRIETKVFKKPQPIGAEEMASLFMAGELD